MCKLMVKCLAHINLSINRTINNSMKINRTSDEKISIAKKAGFRLHHSMSSFSFYFVEQSFTSSSNTSLLNYSCQVKTLLGVANVGMEEFE